MELWGRGGALAVLLIPLLTADAPVPLEHGLAAVRLVLLSDEGLLVSRDLRQVVTALSDHRPDTDKAVADLVLTLRQRSRALVRIGFLDVDALALRVSGRCRSVRHDDVVAVFVTVLFLGFLQGALDVLDSSGADSCSCHVARAMAQNDSRPRRSYDLSPCSRSSVRKNKFLRPEGESPLSSMRGVKVG